MGDTEWELRKGDIVIGRMHTRQYGEMFWYIYTFESTPVFEQEYRHLFDEENRMANSPGFGEIGSDDDEQWNRVDEIYYRLNSELTLFSIKDGKAAENFLLHITGDRADFRVLFGDE